MLHGNVSEISQEVKATRKKLHKADQGKEVDREMEECLSRLKVWQTENLMAPQGMDRFFTVPLVTVI